MQTEKSVHVALFWTRVSWLHSFWASTFTLSSSGLLRRSEILRCPNSGIESDFVRRTAPAYSLPVPSISPSLGPLPFLVLFPLSAFSNPLMKLFFSPVGCGMRGHIMIKSSLQLVTENGIVVPWVKPPVHNAGILYECWFQSWMRHFQTSSVFDAPGKAVEDDPSTWEPYTHLGDPDGAPGFKLRPGPLCPIWGVTALAYEFLSLSLSLILALNK